MTGKNAGPHTAQHRTTEVRHRAAGEALMVAVAWRRNIRRRTLPVLSREGFRLGDFQRDLVGLVVLPVGQHPVPEGMLLGVKRRLTEAERRVSVDAVATIRGTTGAFLEAHFSPHRRTVKALLRGSDPHQERYVGTGT